VSLVDGFVCSRAATSLPSRTKRGRRGVPTLLGKVMHVDLRLPDGEFLFEVPIDYIRAEPG
jgi:hypothetical protein